MTKHKIKTVSIIIGSIIPIGLAITTVSGVVATKIINERKIASQPTIDSTQVAEFFFSEDNPAFLTKLRQMMCL